MANKVLQFRTKSDDEQLFITIDEIRFDLSEVGKLSVAQQVRLTNLNKVLSPLFEKFQEGDLSDTEGDDFSEAMTRLAKTVLVPRFNPEWPEDFDPMSLVDHLHDSDKLAIVNAFTSTSPAAEERTENSSESPGTNPSPDSTPVTVKSKAAGRHETP